MDMVLIGGGADNRGRETGEGQITGEEKQGAFAAELKRREMSKNSTVNHK